MSEDVYVGGLRVHVVIRDGILNAMIRAKDKATFEAQALATGLKVLDDAGRPAPARGVDIAELGPLVLVPGVYDGDTEITPPVMDGRHHVNFWLSPALVASGAWQTWAVAWSTHGQPAPANADEVALLFQDVELVDPQTVRSPSNRLL